MFAVGQMKGNFGKLVEKNSKDSEAQSNLRSSVGAARWIWEEFKDRASGSDRIAWRRGDWVLGGVDGCGWMRMGQQARVV